MFLGGPGVLGGQDESCSIRDVFVLVEDCGTEGVGGVESLGYKDYVE